MELSSPLSSPLSENTLNVLGAEVDGIQESKLAITLEPPYNRPAPEDLKSWPGWLEIDSDELVSNTLLREWGVSGVKLHPVFGLSEELIAELPYPVYGVVFCFGYQNVDAGKQEGVCPEGIWFANQEHGSLNCGSLAILNIINNLPLVDLGPKLQEFKDATMSLTSVERGEKLYTFEHVRAVHNSFVKFEEMAEMDLYLSRLEKKAALKTNKAKAKPKSSKAVSSPSSSAEDYFEKDPAFHFIAYMPINDRIYKFDGMDQAPQDMGPCDHVTWLYKLSEQLISRMNAFEGDGIRYNLQAVVDDPMVETDLAEDAENAKIMRGDRTDFAVMFLRFLAENGELKGLAEKEIEPRRAGRKGRAKGRR
jgi:ubiquitin carboxyl-terminal hydrolase L5